MWTTIEVADFNKDQKPDLLIGNIGANVQFKVSESEPAELVYKDFDKNGSVDLVFCFYVQGISYPFLTRDELVKQLPRLKNKFNNYEVYSNATMADVFTKEELKDASHLTVNHLETTLFLSTSTEKFQVKALPVQVQYAPVNTISVFDYDKNGNLDILLCGNNQHAKLRLGSMQANYGTLLKGDGQGTFEYIPQTKSGFNLQGDIKEVIQIDDILFFGINQKNLVNYKIN